VTHEGNPMIDAGALHGWLGAKTRYTQWLQERIAEYGFSEGGDFFWIIGKTGPKGGRPRTDYLLTVDMAKELSMVERTDPHGSGKPATREHS
jgi:phage anti-repressor protein